MNALRVPGYAVRVAVFKIAFDWIQAKQVFRCQDDRRKVQTLTADTKHTTHDVTP